MVAVALFFPSKSDEEGALVKQSCPGRIKMCSLPTAFSRHYVIVLATSLLMGSTHILVAKLFAGI